jgi:hypothetical protein
LKEHPNAKIIVTYWSKEDVVKFGQEISQQCNKPITPAAMYKAEISEDDLKSIAWIDDATKTLICSFTEGKGITTPTPTITVTHTPIVTTLIITQNSTPTPILPPTPTSIPTETPTPAPTPILSPTPMSIPTETPTPAPTLILPPTPTSIPTETPTLAPTPASISLPVKTMTVGETWNLGNGYTLETPAIDQNSNPRTVWIVFSQNGHRLDEYVMNEGLAYTYGNIFSTKIASIFSITNAKGVLAGAVRFDNSILTPTSN